MNQVVKLAEITRPVDAKEVTHFKESVADLLKAISAIKEIEHKTNTPYL